MLNDAKVGFASRNDLEARAQFERMIAKSNVRGVVCSCADTMSVIINNAGNTHKSLSNRLLYTCRYIFSYQDEGYFTIYKNRSGDVHKAADVVSMLIGIETEFDEVTEKIKVKHESDMLILKLKGIS